MAFSPVPQPVTYALLLAFACHHNATHRPIVPPFETHRLPAHSFRSPFRLLSFFSRLTPNIFHSTEVLGITLTAPPWCVTVFHPTRRMIFFSCLAFYFWAAFRYPTRSSYRRSEPVRKTSLNFSCPFASFSFSLLFHPRLSYLFLQEVPQRLSTMVPLFILMRPEKTPHNSSLPPPQVPCFNRWGPITAPPYISNFLFVPPSSMARKAFYFPVPYPPSPLFHQPSLPCWLRAPSTLTPPPPIWLLHLSQYFFSPEPIGPFPKFAALIAVPTVFVSVSPTSRFPYVFIKLASLLTEWFSFLYTVIVPPSSVAEGVPASVRNQPFGPSSVSVLPRPSAAFTNLAVGPSVVGSGQPGLTLSLGQSFCVRFSIILCHLPLHTLSGFPLIGSSPPTVPPSSRT